jgi:hypothetical protein
LDKTPTGGTIGICCLVYPVIRHENDNNFAAKGIDIDSGSWQRLMGLTGDTHSGNNRFLFLIKEFAVLSQ